MTQDNTRRQEKRAARRAAWLRVLKEVWSYLLITVGCLLTALAAVLFFIPNQIVTGGVTGIATLLYYALGTPVGLVSLLLNIPLLVAAAVWLGGLRSLFRTIWGVIVLSVAIDMLQPCVTPLTADPLLYSLYGGLLDGLGLGLVFLARGTTGGTDIVAQLCHRWFGIRLGHTLLITNVVILGTSSIMFGIEPVLYAIFISYISTKVIDLVQEGSTRSRTSLIITQHADAIMQDVFGQLDRGATILQGEGGYTGTKRQVVLCAVSQSEVSKIKRIVSNHDDDAFVIIFPSSEVLGEGFQGLGKRP